MSKEELWQTSSGDVISVDEMSELHAKNCLKLMMRRSRDADEIISQLQTKLLHADTNHVSDVDLIVQAHYLGQDPINPITSIDDVQDFNVPVSNWKPRQ